jgi:Flp pilus assembly protein TadG
MVEFAIVVPVLMILLMGIIDFGRALFLYNNLASAVREGARFAAVQASPCAAASKTATIARTQNYITNFGGNAGGGTVTVTCLPSDAAKTQIQVTVTAYPFTALTPLPQLNSLTMTESAIFRWEGAGPSP